jgi:hypothetical protein
MTDFQNKLYVDLSETSDAFAPEAVLEAADGYILATSDLPSALDIEGKDILLQDVLSQEPFERQMADQAQAHICRLGLAETAGLRDEFPDLAWIPRVDVTRLETAYHFPTTNYSECFRTFQPVFPSDGPFRVSDGETALSPWLERAKALGFDTIWLHNSQYEAYGTGLDLDLRELALKTWGGNLWLSGGASTMMHVRYLVQEGGLDALVIPLDLACELGCDKIRTALRWGMDRPEIEPELADQGGDIAAVNLRQTG